jgi:hypothetical protein
MRLLAALLAVVLSMPALAQQDELSAALKNIQPGDTVTIRMESAKGVGVGGTASGDKAELKVDGSPPAVSLDAGMRGTGGGGKASGWAAASETQIVRALCAGLGAMCILAAGLCVIRGWGIPRAPIVLVAVGAGLLTCAMQPWLLPFVLIGAVGFLAFPYVWAELNAGRIARTSERYHEALRAVVAGVEESPEHARQAVKAEIAKQVDPPDRDTIRDIKRADEL